MDISPKVSVGMPVYNGEKTLAKAIESILYQDYENLEIIISDNASTDSTYAISQHYKELDSRIRYSRFDENFGTIRNFNNVFKLSSGEFFMWVAHDDYHDPGFISECIRAFASEPEAALCSPIMRGFSSPKAKSPWTADLSSFKEKSTTYGRYLEVLSHFPAVAIYGMYRSSAVQKTTLLPDCMGADLLFIQELSLYGKFIQCDKMLFTYYGRDKWNTVDEDYAVFYGKDKKPWYYSPFLVVLLNQIKILVNCKHTKKAKTALLSILLLYQTQQFIVKVTLKIIKYMVPGKWKMILAKKIYWRFIHSRNVKAEADDEFLERIIRPSVGIRI